MEYARFADLPHGVLREDDEVFGVDFIFGFLIDDAELLDWRNGFGCLIEGVEGVDACPCYGDAGDEDSKPDEAVVMMPRHFEVVWITFGPGRKFWSGFRAKCG
jgi:hypothetical protein